MAVTLLVGVAAAVLFYRVADHERMSPLLWSVASLGITAIITLRGPGTAKLLLGQVVLFAVMWSYNTRRQQRRMAQGKWN